MFRPASSGIRLAATVVDPSPREASPLRPLQHHEVEVVEVLLRVDQPEAPGREEVLDRRQGLHDGRVPAPLLAHERGAAHVRDDDAAARREAGRARRQHRVDVREELQRRDEEDRVPGRLLPPRDELDEMSGQPWYSVGPKDIFPEEFRLFFSGNARARAAFDAQHADLYDADFWTEQQEQIRNGVVQDFYPYPRRIRFSQRQKVA